MKRRDLFALAAGSAGLARPLFAQSAGAPVRPTWLSFGLNGPDQGVTRFPATMALARSGRLDLQAEVSRAIQSQLRPAGIANFKDSAEINEGLLLGAVLDYENVLTARLGAASLVVLHLVGHGVLLAFDRARGWKMISSFPFPVALLRESVGGDPVAQAGRHLFEAFTDGQNSFASSFVKTASRLAPRWREAGRGFNVRVMNASIHPAAQDKLAAWGIGGKVNAVWLGHLSSAAACEGLGIPIVPFAETQALGKFTYKFSERLVAQDVRLPAEDDVDLRVHVVLRNVSREIKYRGQLQRWEVVRLVVMDLKVLDDRNEEVVSFRTGYQDELPDSLVREEDNTPARDAHFFDMAIYRCLQTLFVGVDRGDEAALARVFVKPDADQKQRIERFRKKYQQAI